MKLKTSIKQLAKFTIHYIAANFGPHRWPSREPRLWIMMYHRVLPQEDPRAAVEEAGMIVTPETFEMHLQTIKKHFTPVSLENWIHDKLAGRPLPPKACAITFDDGWLDNYEFAWPLLQEYQMPATIYIASALIGTNSSFWPNRLARIIDVTKRNFSENKAFSWLQELSANVDINLSQPNYLAEIIWLAKQKPEPLILSHLEKTELILSKELKAPPSELMNWQQVKELANSELIDIGSHTQSHIELNENYDNERIIQEVTASKKQIEEKLNNHVTLFSYPYGRFSDLAKLTVENTYLCAITTQQGFNTKHCDRMELKRIRVHNEASDTATKLLARMSGWI